MFRLKFEPVLLFSQGREIEDTDHFVFNEEFENKLRRLKINSIQIKETVQTPLPAQNWGSNILIDGRVVGCR
jgi:hypothetical protein